MQQLQHPNIVRLFEIQVGRRQLTSRVLDVFAQKSEKHIYLVLEYCSGASPPVRSPRSAAVPVTARGAGPQVGTSRSLFGRAAHSLSPLRRFSCLTSVRGRPRCPAPRVTADAPTQRLGCVASGSAASYTETLSRKICY